MAKLFKDGYFQPNDTVGRSLAGAQLFFYTAGTTSPKNTYTSKDLSSTNAHPVVADAAGRFPPIWLDGAYDVDLKDSDNVLIDTLEDVGATDETINTTASLQFKTLADLKALEAQNGLTVDPGIGDALHTTGKTTTTDDEGADWVVVAAGTGTPDDDLYVDLANGLQAERVFNNLYRKNNGSDIENAATFRTNIDVYSKGESDSAFLEDSAGSVSATNLATDSVTGIKVKTNSISEFNELTSGSTNRVIVDISSLPANSVIYDMYIKVYETGSTSTLKALSYVGPNINFIQETTNSAVVYNGGADSVNVEYIIRYIEGS